MRAPKHSIFICYRRDDSQNPVGRLYDRLVRFFGKDAVFLDVHGIPAGVKFREHIQPILTTCQVGLVIIGPDWQGASRLQDPDDQLRIECETLLSSKTTLTIPCLVRQVETLKGLVLPESLSPLKELNWQRIRDDRDFENDFKDLRRHIEQALRKRPSLVLRYSALFLTGLAAIALYTGSIQVEAAKSECEFVDRLAGTVIHSRGMESFLRHQFQDAEAKVKEMYNPPFEDRPAKEDVVEAERLRDRLEKQWSKARDYLSYVDANLEVARKAYLDRNGWLVRLSFAGTPATPPRQ